MLINPNYHMYLKIHELQDKIILLTDQLADANFKIKQFELKEKKQCLN